MKTSLIACVAAASLTFAAAGTQASPVVGSTPSTNVVFGAMEGWVGANLYAMGNSHADLWYLGADVSESVTNIFTFQGGNHYDTDTWGANTGLSSLFGDSFVPRLLESNAFVPHGLINFSFTTWQNGSSATFTNGDNGPQSTPTLPNLFLSFASCPSYYDDPDHPSLTSCVFDTDMNGTSAGAGKYVLIAFNDGSERPSGNSTHPEPMRYRWDDMVLFLAIRPKDTSIPEPASLGLLGLGLAALGLSGRRRRAR